MFEVTVEQYVDALAVLIGIAGAFHRERCFKGGLI